MPLAPANGTVLHYETAGEGPALCLIAGFRQSSAAWPRVFVDRMARRHRVITFDNRGTGRSPPTAGGYALDNQARDVTGLLDALGLARAHLLGFSMGGAIAQAVATGHPDRVNRLILFGTFCGGPWATPAPWSVLCRLFVTEQLTPEQAARRAWPVTYATDYLAANPQAVEQQMRRELEHPTPEFVARHQSEAIRRFDGTARCRPSGRPRWSLPGLRTCWCRRVMPPRWPLASGAPGWSCSTISATAPSGKRRRRWLS